MVISLLFQAKILIFSIMAGILTGLIFDLYRIIFGYEGVSRLLIIIGDILFWVLSALIIFLFLLYTNQAFTGIYVCVFIFVGIFIYLKTLSIKVKRVCQATICLLSKVIRTCFKLMIYPLKVVIYRFIRKNKVNFHRNDLNNM